MDLRKHVEILIFYAVSALVDILLLIGWPIYSAAKRLMQSRWYQGGR